MNLKGSLIRFLIHVIRFCYWTCHDFYFRSGFTRAGSLAYNLLLSFVPFAVVIISMMSFFPAFDQILTQVEQFIFINFVPHTGGTVLGYLESFQGQAKTLPWISFIFLFITSIMMLMSVESNLNDMWQIHKPRRFGLSFLVHWGLMTIGPLLLSASLLLSSFVLSSNWFQGTFNTDLLVLLPYLCSLVAFTFLYVSVPGCRVSLRAAFVGGLFAAIFFELTKAIFTIYAQYFPTYRLLYGALATIPIFLIWLYLCSFIFLLGAQVVHALQSHQAYQPLYSMYPRLNKIAQWIESFYNRSFQRSEGSK